MKTPLVVMLALFALTIPIPNRSSAQDWLSVKTGNPSYPDLWYLSVPEGYLVKSVGANGTEVAFVPDSAHQWHPDNLVYLKWGMFDGHFLHLTKIGGPAPLPNAAYPGNLSVAPDKIAYIDTSGGITNLHLIDGETLAVAESPDAISQALEH